MPPDPDRIIAAYIVANRRNGPSTRASPAISLVASMSIVSA
jgi:hypothetical protein